LQLEDVIDGKYRIVRLLGEGGMGAVYEGENTLIHRRVAIKVLHAHVAKNAEAAQRFEREAQAAGRIGSEHIVEVLDLGSLPNGDRYMVMEFLEGESLSQRIRSHGRLSPEELAPIAMQMLDALAAAHGAGIVHRDLKPDNVYLLKSRRGRADFVKLLDFGISKFNLLNKDSGFSMTRTGAVMGTPFYMAPEQAKGSRTLDLRVDLYSAGVILYEALSGRVPFQAETFNELLFKIALESPMPLEQVVPEMDPGVAAVVSRAMAREPDQRFQTALEFRAAIETWFAGGPATLSVPPVRRGATPATAEPAPIVPTIGVTVPGQTTTAPGQPMTHGNWSNTSGGGAKKRHTALLVTLGALTLVTVGGGGVFWKMRLEDAPGCRRGSGSRAASGGGASSRGATCRRGTSSPGATAPRSGACQGRGGADAQGRGAGSGRRDRGAEHQGHQDGA
jgi:eukaryotic-like serine/threonine-protein kinase